MFETVHKREFANGELDKSNGLPVSTVICDILQEVALLEYYGKRAIQNE
jgi:hypothetical protein